MNLFSEHAHCRRLSAAAVALLLVLATGGAARAQNGKLCILKGSTSTNAPAGTPCTDNMAEYNSTRTVVAFNEQCSSPKSIDVVFEQPAGNATLITAYQVAITYNPEELADPVCTPDPQNLFFDMLGLDCPGTHAQSGKKYIFTGNGNITGEGSYPNDNPNFLALRVQFGTSHLTEGATGTIQQFTESAGKISKVIDMNSNTISDNFDADVVCRIPTDPVIVEPPSQIAGTLGSNMSACTPESCLVDVTLSYTLPTTCRYLDYTGPCASLPWQSCTPGVAIIRTGPTTAIITEYTTQTSVTTSVDLSSGSASFNLYGTCSSSDRSGTPATINLNPPCCAGWQISSGVLMNNMPYDPDVEPGDPACGMFLANSSISFDGTVTGADGSAVLKILYGHATGVDVFPQESGGSSDSQSRFSLDLPAPSVYGPQDLYWALEVTDPFFGFTSYLPAGFDGSINTAAKISGACIKGAPATFWGSDPYPNQMPFQAGHGEPLVIGFWLNEEADIQFSIYSVDGREVRHISSSAMDPEITPNTCNWRKGCSWDGTDNNGNLISNGLYIINLYVVGTGQYFNGQSVSLTKGLVVMK